MLITCMCTPIFINTFVVFIRLYWFEKRFQNVVLEARSLRRTKTRTRTKSEAKKDLGRDLGHEEFGVGNREIVVLRNPDGEAEGGKIEDDDQFMAVDPDSRERAGSAGEDAEISQGDASDDQPRPPFHRDITFADELGSVKSHEDRQPEKRSKEQIIAFVENQRNPKDRGTLRIPGPRDFDLGYTPERIEEGDELDREFSNEGDVQMKPLRSNSVPHSDQNQQDHPFKAHITIDAPDRPRRPNTGPSAYNRIPRATEEEPHAGMHLRNRSRSRTFGSFMSKAKDDEEEHDPMPYLSWTPTVGRNSAFVDLTEEQREELGGIEYRSLKLLAIILVCKFHAIIHWGFHLTQITVYYVGFHLLGMLCMLPWIVRDKHYSDIVRGFGVSPIWW